jgi:alpha-beta hydrolase superfamily lysophospholipase
MRLRPALLVLLAAVLVGCGPKTFPAGAPVTVPRLTSDALIARDGARLPLRRWMAPAPAEGVIIALHGYTDYSAAFERLGPWLARHGYDVLAYDQRGFGNAPHPGFWAGTDSLAADLEDAIEAVRVANPGRPVYVLGESMGGSVAMVAAAAMAHPPAGLVLAAPGVRDDLPWRSFWDATLWLGAHLTPGLTVEVDRYGPSSLTSVSAGRLRDDPLVIQQIRADSYHGVITLADRASEAATGIEAPVLMLHGGEDTLVRRVSVCAATRVISGPTTLRLYPDAPHLLLHWQRQEMVWQDALRWLRAHADAQRSTPANACAP